MWWLLAYELGGIHPEGLGQLADRAPLRLRHLACFGVEDPRGTHAGILRRFPVRDTPARLAKPGEEKRHELLGEDELLELRRIIGRLRRKVGLWPVGPPPTPRVRPGARIIRLPRRG